MADAKTFRLPRWLQILAVVAAAIGLAFAIWIVASSIRQSASLDAQRTRELAIAADNIATWPRTAAQIARAKLILTKAPGAKEETAAGDSNPLRLYHPDFGDLLVSYSTGVEACPAETVILDGNRIVVLGEALPPDDKRVRPHARVTADEGIRVCFTVGPVALASLIPKPTELKQLLLVGPPEAKGRGAASATPQPEAGDMEASATTDADATPADPRRNGVVLAQVGTAPLPIRRLSELPKIDTAIDRMALAARETLNSTAGVKTVVTPPPPTDALEPTDSRVAGTAYRFYFRPIDLDAGGGRDFYLVGAGTKSIEPAVAPGINAKLIAFTLALALLFALVPVVKLAKLGPVDALPPIQVAAVVLGLLTAVALGTAGWVAARDVLSARLRAKEMLEASAQQLANKIRKDLFAAAGSPQLRELAQMQCGRDELICGRAAPAQGEQAKPATPPPKPRLVRAMGEWAKVNFTSTGRHYVLREWPMAAPKAVGLVPAVAFRPVTAEAPAPPASGDGHASNVVVDMLFVVDSDGVQPERYPSRVRRDDAGVTLELRDRGYFLKTIAGNTPPGSETLRRNMAEGETGLWRFTAGGLVVDQIRSRTDGVPRTVLMAALANRDPAKSKEPAAIAATVVLPSMLAPALPQHVRYAIIDGRGDDWPVLFHSDRGRAHIEHMAPSLDLAARVAIRALLPVAAECAQASDGTTATSFYGIYEGAPTLFGAARVPCTDWVLLTLRSRDALDQMSARAAEHAVVFWAGIFLPAAAIWAALALFLRDRIWCWLWPAAGHAKRRQYREVVIALSAGLVLGGFIWLFSPVRAAGVILVVALGGLAWLAIQHRYAEPRATSSAPPARLDRRDQRTYTVMVTLLMIAISVIPVLALARDAQDYFRAIAKGQDQLQTELAKQDRLLARREIGKVFSLAAQGTNWKPLTPVSTPPCTSDDAAESDDASSASGPPLCWNSPIGRMRRIARFDLSAPFVQPQPTSLWQAIQSRTLAPSLSLRPPGIWICGAMALGLLLLFIVALRSVLRGLFGFGVAFEAIEYPRLPKPVNDAPDWSKLPRRFMVIAAPEAERGRLKRAAKTEGMKIDLFEATRNPQAAFDAAQASQLGPDSLVLFNNLVVLLRDADRRRHALEILESAVRAQSEGRFRIAILVELSPLDRLFHSYEREEEELEALKPEDRAAAYRERAKHREEMRWSSLFEEFTTYLYKARPRRGTSQLGKWPDAAALLLRELEYIPDHAVAPLLTTGKTPPITADDILDWFYQDIKVRPTDAALVNYLQSMLIEHYQFAWSNSSRAERLLLYRFAFGQIPNLGTAYAVRTLVRRGLVALDPYPRIVNRSFAEFVRHIEKPATLDRWRSYAETGPWKLLRTPLMVILPAAFLVIAIAGISRGESLFSLLPPLLVAAGPALIQTLGSGRRVAPA